MNTEEKKIANEIKALVTEGLRESKGHACLNWLIDGRCKRGARTGVRICDLPPRQDHLSRWIDKKSGERILISQPYGIWTEDLAETMKICEVHGVKVLIDARTSWWYPGHTISIEYRMKEREFEV
jgi:hypothetical protein